MIEEHVDEIEGAPQAPTDAPAQDTDAPEVKWQEQFEISNPRFESFKTVKDLANSYTELETHQSQQIRFPSQDAGEEDLTKFNQKMLDNGYYKAPSQDDPDSVRDVMKLLGAPAEATGYEFEQVEGANIDAESEGAFKAVAHEAGLTTAQANAIHNWLGGNLSEAEKEVSTQQAKDEAELKGEWGPAFDHKYQQIQNAASMLESRVPGITDYYDGMKDNGYDTHMLRLMDAVTELLGESGAVPVSPRETLTKQEALARVNEIRNNPDHPANDDGHPDYEKFAQERVKLMKIAYG